MSHNSKKLEKIRIPLKSSIYRGIKCEAKRTAKIKIHLIDLEKIRVNLQNYFNFYLSNQYNVNNIHWNFDF